MFNLVYLVLCLMTLAQSVPLRSKLNATVSQSVNRSPLTPGHPQTFWYEQIAHDGISPFIPGGEKWKVFRNVVAEYGADQSGKVDAQSALQKAINGMSLYISIYSAV